MKSSESLKKINYEIRKRQGKLKKLDENGLVHEDVFRNLAEKIDQANRFSNQVNELNSLISKLTKVTGEKISMKMIKGKCVINNEGVLGEVPKDKIGGLIEELRKKMESIT